jgi:hypothetical protein
MATSRTGLPDLAPRRASSVDRDVVFADDIAVYTGQSDQRSAGHRCVHLLPQRPSAVDSFFAVRKRNRLGEAG